MKLACASSLLLFINVFMRFIWREHFRISRNMFQFVCNFVRPNLLRHGMNMRRAIPVAKRVSLALWRLATENSYTTCFWCWKMHLTRIKRRVLLSTKFPRGIKKNACSISDLTALSDE